MIKMLEGLERPPRLHCFGHVHAKQFAHEAPEGPRLCASKRVPGCLFANVAAERQLPAITGYRLSRKAAAKQLDAGEMLALPAPGAQQSTALTLQVQPISPEEWAQRPDEASQLLMRPPAVIALPLDGFACDCAVWAEDEDGRPLWEVVH